MCMSEDRKNEHISLADDSQIGVNFQDSRFNYEPLIASLPEKNQYYQKSKIFLNKEIKAPLWVSSMTGGGKDSCSINQSLARVCEEFGLGMGLGSCRPYLNNLFKPFSKGQDNSQKNYFEDFNMRPFIGPSLPLMGNLGISQIEELSRLKALDVVNTLIDKLSLDGLFVHINPLQEWTQLTGDKIQMPPLETLQELLEVCEYPIGLKEVGQGFGPKSLKAALNLPLSVIELAGLGGTNFTYLEKLRSNQVTNKNETTEFSFVGHSAYEMVLMINRLLEKNGEKKSSIQFIISGGMTSFLDGYYLMNRFNAPSIYGHAYLFLIHAKEGYESLYQFVKKQLTGLELANRYLTIKEKCNG